MMLEFELVGEKGNFILMQSEEQREEIAKLIDKYNFYAQYTLNHGGEETIEESKTSQFDFTNRYICNFVVTSKKEASELVKRGILEFYRTYKRAKELFDNSLRLLLDLDSGSIEQSPKRKE